MKLTYYLDKQDIADALARMFRVEPDQVRVGIKTQWAYDGEVNTPFAEIDYETTIPKGKEKR